MRTAKDKTVANPMTPERESLMLARHGTEPFKLSPLHIVQAAAKDLRARQYNENLSAERKRIRKEHGKGSPAYKGLNQSRGYTFLAKHVRRADTVTGLLLIAIEDNSAALTTTKRNTLVVYAGVSRLKAALALAESE
jgi:hypothetical protein